MTAFLMTTYFLIWPVISAAVLLVLIVALIRDMRNAKKQGDGMV